ncbi:MULTISPECIES: hypothetical protein [Aeromonas]|uniref:Uncharacterized protein n=2 Tax=Aeromonas caviae TaxID=648 RepID=A0AA42VG78_AERCA|nr:MULTISPECIES: hypothetical protein [Aeromonas]MBP4059135.1 hypothetical protein [Aeromonas sp. Prich7-2]MCW4617958.1 hypothetical protein [Aeromonas hydrophila]MDH0309505.1 hypothetical protein [Aeromonas caviae]MDH0319936.1 hypothetical protein [Aeromonas caviae]MDH0360212.1 hypothetical protein [Aeromonas caviae]
MHNSLQETATNTMATKPMFDSTMGYLLVNTWQLHLRDLSITTGGASDIMDALVTACGKTSAWLVELVDYTRLGCIFDYDHANNNDGDCLAQVILESVLNIESDQNLRKAVLNWLRVKGLPLIEA